MSHSGDTSLIHECRFGAMLIFLDEFLQGSYGVES